MTINDCVEMNMFLGFVCFSINAKMRSFRDKCVFAFYAEIQWWVNHFGGKTSQDYSADTLRLKNFVEIALSCIISEINDFFFILHNTKTQDSHQ